MICRIGKSLAEIENFLKEKYIQEMVLDELITKHYQLDQINEAFADMESGENARGVIVFN